MRLYTFGILSSIILSIATPTSADIVFTSDRDGSSNIYVMKDDGSNVRQLTDSPLYDSLPTWSPDGSQIAFMRDLHSTGAGKGQQYDLFIMDADGSNLRNVTQHPAGDGNGAWSPDGRSLVFSSDRNGYTDIYTLEIASGVMTQLTDNSKEEGLSDAPSWSPDGQQIVYEHVVPGQGRHVYIMDADGRNARRLLKGPQPHIINERDLVSRGFPRWSPDGEQILYFVDELRWGGRDGAVILRAGNRLIIVDKNGRQPKVLKIPQKWHISKGRWAADGKQVLFAGADHGILELGPPPKYDVYRYHLASGKITNLTNSPNSQDFSADWTRGSLSISPRGKLTTQWAQLKAGGDGN